MSDLLGKKIKAIRKSNGITQEDLAGRLGIPSTTYASKEQKGNFTADELSRICKILGIKENLLNSIVTEKKVDAFETIIHSNIRIEAMLRVMLRSQAEILASQRDESVTKVLSELSKAVNDESEDAFSAL